MTLSNLVTCGGALYISRRFVAVNVVWQRGDSGKQKAFLRVFFGILAVAEVVTLACSTKFVVPRSVSFVLSNGVR